MKLRSSLLLAWKTVSKMKKHSLKTLSSFAGIIFISSAFLGYRSTLVSKMNYLTNERASECYIASDRLVNVAFFPEISETKIRRRCDIEPYILDKIILEIDGERRQGINSQDYDFIKALDETDRNVYFKVDSFAETNNNTVVIATPDIKEYDARFTSSVNKLCVEGKLELNANEVIISDYYLERFGYSDDEFKDLIGKDITFTLSDEGKQEYRQNMIEDSNHMDISLSDGKGILLGPVKLVGIINSHYFYLSSHGNDAQIIVADKNPQKDAFLPPVYYYYSNQFETSVDLSTRLKTQGIIEKDNAVLDTYSTLNILNNVILKVLFFSMLMLSLAIISNYFIAALFSYRETRFFMQMNRALGLSIPQLWLLQILENLYLLIAGGIIGYGLLEAVNYFVSITASRKLEMEISIPHSNILIYVLISSAIAQIYVFISTCICTLLLMKRSMCEDLSCG